MMILVINPGSTSTKMAVFEDEKPILLRTINHSAEELASFEDVLEQKDFRRQLVLDELQRADIPINFDAVIGRGGLVKPLEGGVYEINTLMVRDTLSGIAMHNHACKSQNRSMTADPSLLILVSWMNSTTMPVSLVLR